MTMKSIFNNIWLLLLVVLSIAAYSIYVPMDKAHGESITIGASVEGLAVGPNYNNQLTAPSRYIQPAPNFVQPEILSDATFVGVK